MKDLKIGVIVESFRLGLEDGIKKAAELGAEGVQIYASRGEMAPEDLTTTRKKELLDMIKSNGLVVSALCSEMGGFIGDTSENRQKIDRPRELWIWHWRWKQML